MVIVVSDSPIFPPTSPRTTYNYSNSHTNPSKTPTDPSGETDMINLKDAMVAMSCILNLRSSTAIDYFPAGLVAKASDECYEEGFDHDELVPKLSSQRISVSLTELSMELLKFLYDGVELAVIEFKSQSESKSAVAKQFRKSLKLGKNIHQTLEGLGAKDFSTLCGDVVGFMGSFTRIMRLEDIYVAGKVTDTIRDIAHVEARVVDLFGWEINCGASQLSYVPGRPWIKGG
ncbi:hypothetical protein B0O80DRAFT_502767 [Mortierella sp. GBAus27b]|nr:hypothetical protein B0O80DRAFT_502767 [Mortierella sp. GBAus27b]